MTKSNLFSFKNCSICPSSSLPAWTERLGRGAISVCPYSVATETVVCTPHTARYSASCRPSVVPANRSALYIFISPRGHQLVADASGLGVADKDGGEHIHLRVLQLPQGHHMGLLPLPADVAHIAAGGVRAAVL